MNKNKYFYNIKYYKDSLKNLNPMKKKKYQNRTNYNNSNN